MTRWHDSYSQDMKEMFHDLAVEDREKRAGGYLCVNCPGGCRSPVACDGFGYCRERNMDGAPMDAANRTRRKAESDQVYREVRKL